MNYIKLSKRPFSSTENIYHKNIKNNNYKNYISSFNSPSNKEIINSSLNNNNNTYNNYNFNKNNNIQSSINRIYLNNNINNKKMTSIKNQLFLNSIDSSVQNNNNNKSISIYKKNNNNNNNNNLFHNFNMSSKSINVNKKQSYKSLYNSNIPKFYYSKDKNNISHSHLHTNSNIHSNNKNKAFSMLSLNNRKNSNDSKNSSNTLQVNKKISIRLTKPISNKTLNATNSAINIYNKMNNNNNNVLNNNKINKENIKKFYTNLKKNKLSKINFYNNQYKNKFSINYLANYLKNTVVHKDKSNYININNNNNNHSNKSISINNYINVGSSYRQNNNNSKNKKILSSTEKSSPKVSLYNNFNNSKSNREQSNLNNNLINNNNNLFINNNENKNINSHIKIKFSYDLNNKKNNNNNENLNVSSKKSIINTNLNTPNNYYKNKFNINNNNNNNNDNNKKSIQSKINKIFSQSQKEIFQIKYKHLTSTNSPNKNNINHINEKNAKILINKNDKNKNNNNNNKKTFINNYINQNKKINNSNKNSLNQSKNNNNLPKNEKDIKEISKDLKINKIVELTKQKNNSAKNLKNINTNSTNTNTDRIEALKNNLLNNNINRRISNQINNNINNLNKENNTTLSSLTHDNNYYFSQYLKLSKFIKNFYKENNEYPNTLLSFYKYGRLIGQGAFGKVNIGLNVLTGRIVAIKSFNKQTLLNQGKENKEKILYETDLMRRLNHPNITKILELFETEKYILIILEYINGGNLFSFVKKRRKLNEKTAKFLFKQIIQGIKYIHNNHIVHRDIKLENILIDLNNNIKICDFGIGKILENPNDTILYDQCGTPMYMAPEILLSNRNQGYEAYPVDIWSAGIALYIMLSGTLPFSLSKNNDSENISMEGERKNNLALQYSIIHNDPKPVEKISAEAQNLLSGLLNKNPKNRITIDEILNHPWLKNCNEDNNKFNLFTKAEMILLSKTFVDYRFANIENIKENFTLSNLNKDDINYNNNVNIETKSNILAPYNTIRQIFINNNNNSFDNMNNDFEENEIFNDLKNKEIKIRNGILLFSNKVREFNMNYELNNNGECDNGILINMKTDSNFLNSTINNESNLNNNNNENNFEEEFYNENKKKNINEKQREENILNKIENDFGYKKEYVKKSIENNDLNHARAVFYLMMNYEHI